MRARPARASGQGFAGIDVPRGASPGRTAGGGAVAPGVLALEVGVALQVGVDALEVGVGALGLGVAQQRHDPTAANRDSVQADVQVELVQVAAHRRIVDVTGAPVNVTAAEQGASDGSLPVLRPAVAHQVIAFQQVPNWRYTTAAQAL